MTVDTMKHNRMLPDIDKQPEIEILGCKPEVVCISRMKWDRNEIQKAILHFWSQLTHWIIDRHCLMSTDH